MNLCPITNKHIYIFQCFIIPSAFHPGRMNSSTPGLKTTHSKQQYNESGDFSLRDYSSMDRNVHPGPAGTVFWQSPPSDANIPEIYPNQHYYTIQPGLVDPPMLR